MSPARRERVPAPTRIMTLPGDGIGPEVVNATVQVLERLVPDVELVTGSIGRGPYELTGDVVDPRTISSLTSGRIDGVLFGAAETRPGEPSAVLALRELCQARLTIRPARYRGHGREGTDITVYRELTEDLYVQDERATAHGAEARRPITHAAVERFAELVLAHVPADVPIVVAHKATVLPLTDGTFLEAFRSTAHDHGREVGDRLVDSLAHDLVLRGGGPLAVAAPNVYGDILSDVTSALVGGLGLAPSLTLGDGPPIAEPVHGTAPDIVDQGVANPAATMLSAALLIDHLGYTDEAGRLEHAVDAALADGAVATPDVGGRGNTTAFTRAVLANVGRADQVVPP